MIRRLNLRAGVATALVVCMTGAIAAISMASIGSATASSLTPPQTIESPYVQSYGTHVGGLVEATPGVWSARKYWLGVGEGGTTSVNGVGGPLTMSATSGGVLATFTCEAQFTNAKVENGSSLDYGTGSGKIALSNCKGESPKTVSCKVTPGAAQSVSFGVGSVDGEGERGPEPDAVISSSESSGNLAQFTASGCTLSALNHAWTLSGGSLRGVYSNATSRIEFTPEYSQGVRLETNPATVTGAMGLSTTAGAGIEVEKPTYSYAWKRCSGSSCVTIIGATKSTYKPTAADIGKTLTGVVRATNGAGSTTVESLEGVGPITE
jgi:hypothetical protein